MRQATIDRQRLEQFNRYWEALYKVVPEARKKAVEAMGTAVLRELDLQIQAADLEGDAKGTVTSWQELRVGSKGGYAAVTPQKDTAPPKGKEKQHTWNGKAVTKKQVTGWLERGHGARRPGAGSDRMWNRTGRSGVNQATGRRYVKGRQFYSWTRSKATDIALRAADGVLSEIADEVDY